jgi:hypothetical protein
MLQLHTDLVVKSELQIRRSEAISSGRITSADSRHRESLVTRRLSHAGHSGEHRGNRCTHFGGAR